MNASVEYRGETYELVAVPLRPGTFVVFRRATAIGILQQGEGGKASAIGPEKNLELLQVVARLAT